MTKEANLPSLLKFKKSCSLPFNLGEKAPHLGFKYTVGWGEAGAAALTLAPSSGWD